MPGGGWYTSSGRKKKYKGHTTNYVLLACIVAASGGALFGYDNGITGGVVSMPGFLKKFFPDLVEHQTHPDPSGKPKDPYCTYDDQSLQWFTSSLFIAGVFAALPAGYVTRKFGRKATMLLAGVLFDIGVILMAAAVNFAMLITGRILLGVAVAFASVAVTLYNSEMAPAHMRGRLNQIFQLVLSLGVVVAQWINLGAQQLNPWGWRLSLALAGLPAIVLTLGGIFLPETPNSLIERGQYEEGKKVLQRIRGITAEEAEPEAKDIKVACDQSNSVGNPWLTICKPAYRPQLIVALTGTFFQQWSGINTVIFYSPQLFISLGKSQTAALIATIVTGVINHAATYVSLWTADHKGRRILFLAGGIQMFISLVAIAIILAFFGGHSWTAWVVLVFICTYISAYAWSWGPLGWLYPSEIQFLETRSAGQSICTLQNLLYSFVIGQTYLSMLCAFKWGIFLFFAGMVAIMTVFAFLFYPETKGLSIEEAPRVFRHHWFWKRYAELQVQLPQTEQSSNEDGSLSEPLISPEAGSDNTAPVASANANGSRPS